MSLPRLGLKILQSANVARPNFRFSECGEGDGVKQMLSFLEGKFNDFFENWCLFNHHLDLTQLILIYHVFTKRDISENFQKFLRNLPVA